MTEFDVQQAMVGLVCRRRARERLARRCVAAQENAGNPHYQPTAAAHRTIGPNEIAAARSVGQADGRPARSLLTSPGWDSPGPAVPDKYATRVCRGAGRPRRRRRAGARPPRATDASCAGYEVDRATRDVIDRAGFGSQFIHRTGHSLGQEVHGNGVAHGRLRNARRAAPDPRHRLHDRAGHLHRTSSASAPRSTCSSASAERRGHRTDADGDRHARVETQQNPDVER